MQWGIFNENKIRVNLRNDYIQEINIEMYANMFLSVTFQSLAYLVLKVYLNIS